MNATRERAVTKATGGAARGELSSAKRSLSQLSALAGAIERRAETAMDNRDGPAALTWTALYDIWRLASAARDIADDGENTASVVLEKTA